jgi:ribosome-binding protein aMBF1 (putative translation factor)
MRVSEADREILERVLNVRQILDLEDVLRLIRSEVERAGSQRALARKAGVNISVVSRTLRRQRLPNEKLLRALKLRVVYLSK